MDIVSEFTSLPNELVVEIFQYCSGIEIINAGEAFISDKLWDMISNKKLWEDAVIGPPSEYRKYSKYLGKHTKKLTIMGTTTKKKQPKHLKISSLTESLISSIRLHCPELSHFTVESCLLDSQVIKFSLFPKTLKFLKLSRVTMTNLPQTRLAVRSSPFFSIKSSLPALEGLELCHADYLHSSDSLAIISGCRDNPRLEIREDSHYYTFQRVESEEGNEEKCSGRMTREERKDTKKLFKDLIDYHYVKKSYNTRRAKPQ